MGAPFFFIIAMGCSFLSLLVFLSSMPLDALYMYFPLHRLVVWVTAFNSLAVPTLAPLGHRGWCPSYLTDLAGQVH